MKGYYWNYINLTDKTIYLSNENTEILESEPSVDTTFENPYKVGDTYSFHDNLNYYNCGTITAIDHNKVTVDSLPITSITIDTNKKYYFYVFGTSETNYIESTYGVADFGKNAYVEGKYNYGLHDGVHVEGSFNTAYGRYAHVEGYNNKANYNAHAEGRNNTATGAKSHAEGAYTQANGENSHAEGYFTIANGAKSHAEGQSTTTSGYISHAEGDHTTATGAKSHAEGAYTQANGENSHAEGRATQANGYGSHAGGYSSYANGDYSFSHGTQCRTSNVNETAFGIYNKTTTNSTHFSIGTGTANNDRKNAFEIMQNGDIYIYGKGGYDGTNAGKAGVKTIQQILTDLGVQ